MCLSPQSTCAENSPATRLKAGKPGLELQDALSKQLPREIHQKMLPAGRGNRTIALRQTSKTMRTAVQKADAVVQRGAELVSSRRPRAS